MRRLRVPGGHHRTLGYRLALKGLQNVVAQPHRIALAALRKLDDLFGDCVSFWLIAIVEPKCAAHVRIGTCHRSNRFRLESLILEQAVDGHWSCARLSHLKGLNQTISPLIRLAPIEATYIEDSRGSR